MRAVVAYRGAQEGDGALQLAEVLRRTTQAELSVVAVLPKVSFAGEDRADLEYRDYLERVADEARCSAARVLSPDDPQFLAFGQLAATSVASGLVQAVADQEADLLVLGCAADQLRGGLLLGSVADRLLHSSPVPLLMAPHAYTADPGARFGRLTCAYAGTPQSKEALRATCELALRFDGTVRVATFVPRADTMYPPLVGLDAEDIVAAHLAEQAVALHDEAVSLCRDLGVTDPETVVGRGRGWAGALAALSWDESDLLAIGSSRLGALARVFLGSTATKILRHSPVPVVVFPAGSTAQLVAS